MRLGCSIVKPLDSANSLTCDADTLFPRPEGRSGCVHTATTSWSSCKQRRKVETALSGVPMNTIRIFSLETKKYHQRKLVDTSNPTYKRITQTGFTRLRTDLEMYSSNLSSQARERFISTGL